MQQMRVLVSGCTATVDRLRGRDGDYLGHLVTPANWNSIPSTGLPWAVDNGAFSGLDEQAFRILLARLADSPVKPIWVACPDVVGSAAETMQLWPGWSMTIRAHGLEPAYVLQDNQHERTLPDARAFFVGGSTVFKEGKRVWSLVDRCKKRGAMVHMGRVNSRRRLWLAWELGIDTVDGTGFSKWGDKRLPMIVRWIKQFQAMALIRQLDRLGLEGLIGK